MGSVYRGERIKLGRIVAVKVLNESVPDEATRRRFEREALAMAKLEHPHVGSVIDVGIHDGCPYVVMEFVDGQNLKEFLKSGPLPIARAVDITRQILSGLAHAHEHGIIHRDIKPANIVLSQKSGVGDHAKILDFGIARSVQDTTNLTGALVLGTPNYMAPEQIRGGEIDHRVDLYACGILLFELLTGAKPFHAEDPMAVCMQHLNFAPPPLAAKLNRSFGALEAVVARALAKEPAQRFANAEEFSRELAQAASQVAAAPPPSPRSASPDATVPLDPVQLPVQLPVQRSAVAPTPSKPTSRRVLAIGGGVVVVVAIVIGIAIIAKSDASSEPSLPLAKVEVGSDPKTPAASTSDAAELPPPPPTPPKPIETEPPPDRPSDPAPSDPVADLVAQSQQMTASGRRQAAIMMLQRARKAHPQDPRLPYQTAKLFLEKMWWPDGLKHARAAIALDPAYKNDPELIKLALKCFNTTAGYDWQLAGFLHDDIGAGAKPFLAQTASSDRNPIVRNRAAAELRRYP